jgi:hypothetical protein
MQGTRRGQRSEVGCQSSDMGRGLGPHSPQGTQRNILEDRKGNATPALGTRVTDEKPPGGVKFHERTDT